MDGGWKQITDEIKNKENKEISELKSLKLIDTFSNIKNKENNEILKLKSLKLIDTFYNIDNTGIFVEFKGVSNQKIPAETFEKYQEMIESRIEEQSTGNIISPSFASILEYPFDQYTIKVALSDDNKFIGITEVVVDKDFRSMENILRNIKVHNLEEFNAEE